MKYVIMHNLIRKGKRPPDKELLVPNVPLAISKYWTEGSFTWSGSHHTYHVRPEPEFIPNKGITIDELKPSNFIILLTKTRILLNSFRIGFGLRTDLSLQRLANLTWVCCVGMRPFQFFSMILHLHSLLFVVVHMILLGEEDFHRRCSDLAFLEGKSITFWKKYFPFLPLLPFSPLLWGFWLLPYSFSGSHSSIKNVFQ